MIASSEATDILRNGWADAAAALAPELPDLAQLFAARLDEAFASGQTTEEDLLRAVDEVAATAVRAGSAQSPVLARRLRRTVYEYLLALDASAAVQPQPVAAPGLGATSPALDGAATAPTEPVSPPALTADDDAPAPDRGGAATWVPRVHTLPEPPMWTTHAAAASVVRIDAQPAHLLPVGQEGSDEHETSPADAPLAGAADVTPAAGDPVEHEIAAEDEAAAPSDDDDDLAAVPHPAWYLDRSILAESTEEAPATGAPPAQELPVATSENEPEPAAGLGAPVDVTEWSPLIDVADVVPQTAPDLGAPTVLEPVDDIAALAAPASGEPAVAPRFVAPRDGFHIVDGDLAGDDVAAAAPPSTFAAFSSDATPDAPAAAMVSSTEPVDDWLRVLRNGHADAGAATAGGAHALEAFDDEFDDEDSSWQVRNAASRAAGASGTSDRAGGVADGDDPFAQDPHLADTRRKIQDRLRRKRCDEAAALLQLLAQDAGGRAVAELAMDAGDRCRALGKTNAALNCYLAASRSDPVYELPLSRLADICIDDQDIELAVTYLERIARLARMRGDDKAALRVYRRIATVAPYREDILALLMQVQSGARPTV